MYSNFICYSSKAHAHQTNERKSTPLYRYRRREKEEEIENRERKERKRCIALCVNMDHNIFIEKKVSISSTLFSQKISL